MMETAVIQLTQRCPLNCPQCYMKKSDREMDVSLVFDLIDKAKENGVKAIQFTGGEPMTYSKLNDVIRYCHAKDIYTMVATSGYNHSVSGYAALFASGLTALCVSLNSTDESENIATRDGYRLSMAAMDDVLALEAALFVNIVVSAHNVVSLRETVDELVRKGCEMICLLKRFPSAQGEIVRKLSTREIRMICDVVDAYPQTVQVENCFLEYWFYRNQKNYSCRDAGRKSYFVAVDGTVSPCSQSARYAYADVTHMQKEAGQWRRGYCYAENI